jgi:predicted peptidase
VIARALGTIERMHLIAPLLACCVLLASAPIDPPAATPPAAERAPASTPREIARGETILKKPDGSVDATYRYRLVEPSADALAKAGGKLPLIVFFHGSGERGSDNEAQLKHFAGWTATEEFQSRAPSFVFAMQCPADESWAAIDLKAFKERGEFPKLAKEPTRAMRAAMQQLDELLATKPIDRDRVYLTGLSMGGFGAFDLAARKPELFAAVVPICGGGDPATAATLATIPFYIVHSNFDPVVPNELSRRMSKEISNACQRSWQAERKRAAGANPPQPMPKRVPNPSYREYDGVGHDSWTPAYKFGDQGVLDWMFAKRKQPRQGAGPISQN